MHRTPAIHVAGLVKSHGDCEVLRGVDLDVEQGTILAVVPVAPRLLRLLEDRGWTGWTKLERIGPPS